MFGHGGKGFFLEFQYPQFPSAQLGYSSNASTRSVQNNLDSYYPVHPLSPWDFESEISAVKKVLGTDDFQVVNSAQKDGQSNSPLAIECISRASRYSPEERKERIERYRSKRNLRNFNKKIKV
ncbi:UNVERIFIED_CONTAM: hypothetical protein Sangu_0321800 [Sesamum angustifolium]|uniref:Uncharacterized protein n=1 Tax=Sesamum angustifolium TaxID=2727405 RepID=A0AAW2QR70_9LAMI